jgi:uncharacterized membrane protein HdeD (DUF308 family)
MTSTQTPQLTALQATVLGKVAHNANLLIGLGVMMLVLGTIGFFGQTVFSLISVSVLGGFAIAAGLLQGYHAMQSHGWKSVGIQLIMSILYIVAGLYVCFFPLASLTGLTLWLAVFFFFSGLMRIFQAFQHRLMNGWVWAAVSGLISIILAALIMSSWPSSSLWVPGMLIAIELVLQGWSLVIIGSAAKALAK